jgi:hypothetical protein
MLTMPMRQRGVRAFAAWHPHAWRARQYLGHTSAPGRRYSPHAAGALSAATMALWWMAKPSALRVRKRWRETSGEWRMAIVAWPQWRHSSSTSLNTSSRHHHQKHSSGGLPELTDIMSSSPSAIGTLARLASGSEIKGLTAALEPCKQPRRAASFHLPTTCGGLSHAGRYAARL